MEGNVETIVKSKELSVAEKIEAREQQSKISRIVEYITGLKLEDPKLIDRLEEDQRRIRSKYGLPDRNFKFENSSEYERYLRQLAEVNGVKIRPEGDCGKFFDKFSMVGGVYMDKERVIGVTIDKFDKDEYISSLVTFEHETIHSLQHKYYPEMPIEVQEYEAYLANWNIDYLREDGSRAIEIVFGFGVAGSILHWYRQTSEEVGYEIKPEWDSPEFFLLNVDGVSEKQIVDYQKSQTKEVTEEVK